jgi:hypothetical protein
MGGAQNGTYMIHPNHMNVDYPSNVNDNAINSRGDYARPDDVATEMSFFRFRCKGTKLFREVVDATWEAGDSLAYETVLEFDKKFSDMILEFDRTFDKVKGVLALQNTDETWRAIASMHILEFYCLRRTFKVLTVRMPHELGHIQIS